MYSIPQYQPSAHAHQEAAASPESVWDWEREERARNAIESGYPDWGRKGGRPAVRGASNGMYSKTIEATWGVDDAAYDASLAGEFPHDEGSARVFRKRPAGVGNPGQHLSGQQFVELYSAVSYANHLGIVMNVHVSITWGLLGIHGQNDAAKTLRYEFFKHLQEWCEYRMQGRQPFVWLYVHEEGRRHGFHTHLLTAIPDELRGEFREWMAKRMSSLSRSGVVPKGAYKIVAPPSDKIGRQWRYLQYLCKGIGGGEELASSVGTEPRVKAASLIRVPGGRPVDVRCRKRCGVSNNIGRQARRNGRYESLLERGVTDALPLGNHGSATPA